MDVAARAIAVGILSNTALKIGLVLSIGGAPFKTFGSTALAAMAVGLIVGWHVACSKGSRQLRIHDRDFSGAQR
jgi:hypothetical protein